ncbi:MAG: hypothetical protein R3B47_19340 [Bacteroidia bacterium]
MNQQADIVRDISFLYELSLSIGRSLDLKENCANFVDKLVARKNLSLAEVWIDQKEMGTRKEDIQLIYARPGFRTKNEVVSHQHPICQYLRRTPAITVDAEDPLFGEFIQHEELQQGAVALLRLGRMGYLKLYDANRKGPFSKLEINQLRQVIETFTISIEACLSHSRFKENNEALIAKENYLKSINDFVAKLLLCKDVDEVLSAIHDTVTGVFGFPNCYIYIRKARVTVLCQDKPHGEPIQADRE